MSKQIKILNKIIEPGKRYQFNLDIARLHTRTKLDVPVIIERGEKDGPCLLLSGGIHGNEVNGVEIVRQIIAKGYNKPDYGMIMCVPVLNVFGFISQTREFPDGRDLNRVFPGSQNGSLASRFAWYFMNEIVPHADYCIDFHTGGASRFNYSQLRIEEDDKEVMELAKIFGTKFIKSSSLREKSYRESATMMGKKVLLFEGGKSLNLDRMVTKSGLFGTLRVINHLKMKSYPQELLNSFKAEEEPVLFSSSSWVRAKHSGLFRSYTNTGKHVKKGEVIGSITDPYGDFERKIRATHSGYIICSNHAPIVNQGDAVFHITSE